jgi:hypothetical protein
MIRSLDVIEMTASTDMIGVEEHKILRLVNEYQFLLNDVVVDLEVLVEGVE